MKMKKRKQRGRGDAVSRAIRVEHALQSRGFCGARGLREAAGLAIAAALVCAFAPLSASAKEKQPTRTVTGTVLDKSDNPIASAAVVLTDLETGKKSATYTKEDGIYEFAGLQPTRNYQVQATYQGESSQVRKVSPFDPRDRIVLNLKIPPEE